MANWTTNVIVVEEKDYDKLQELLVNENGKVDFNKLIKRPKDLDIDCPCYNYLQVSKWSADKNDRAKELMIGANMRMYYTEELTQEEFVNVILNKPNVVKELVYFLGIKSENDNTQNHKNLENYIKSYFNHLRYGYTNWYDWNIDKWGVKKNAFDTAELTFGTSKGYSFTTAWDTPDPILEELAKHIDFKYAYTFEGDYINGVKEYWKDQEDNEVQIHDVDMPYTNTSELDQVIKDYDVMEVYNEETEEFDEVETEEFIECRKQYIDFMSK